MTGEPFLLWGMIGFVACLIVYLTVVIGIWRTKPELVAVIEMLASCIAISGGVKIGWSAVQATLGTRQIVLTGEEIYYVIFGCIALVWISIVAIIRAFK